MADATVTLNPSEQIIKAANALEYVQAGEMKIGLKKPNILQQYDIVEALGDTAQNTTYMQMVMPILWVAEIDGEAQGMPSTKRELRALIQRLGEDGVSAIMGHLVAKAETLNQESAIKN